MIVLNGQTKNKTLFYLLLFLLLFKIIAIPHSNLNDHSTQNSTISGDIGVIRDIISKNIKFNLTNLTIEDGLLNNIRIFGEHPYRYITFGTFSSGDMLIETTSCPKSPKRVFYGLKQNGRPFFKNRTNNEETPFYSINASTTSGQYEIESSIIKSSDPNHFGKEYFFSL